MTAVDRSGLALTAASLVAFAANSVLCRAALGSGAIDAATFSTVRLVSGAITLVLAAALTAGDRRPQVKGSWWSAALLFLYAIPFSFAYTGVSAGTGALILFGAVQITMISAALTAGEPLTGALAGGLALAIAGLLILVAPGLAAPPLGGAMLMALAGAAWGFYSLRGRGAADPLAETSGNFVRAVPMALLVSAAWLPRTHADRDGVLLATASGALASGLGYVTWYAALRHLSAARASVVQLTVPVIAALGGVLFLGESVSWRLIAAGAAVIGGVSLVLTRGVRR
jgi:drug/metabolite transporter (DMT)-like permease